MEPPIAVSITVGVIALAGGLAVLLRSHAGRVRRGDGSSFAPGDLPGLSRLGWTATLVQFSTEFCARCPDTRLALRRLSAERAGVDYLDVDLTNDPDLASRLHILQTPTVLVLDASGRVASRIGGPPRADSLRRVLDGLATTGTTTSPPPIPSSRGHI